MRNDVNQKAWTEYQIRQWERAEEERWESEAESERQKWLAKHPAGCSCQDHPKVPDWL